MGHNQGPWQDWAGYDSSFVTGAGMCGRWISQTAWRHSGNPTMLKITCNSELIIATLLFTFAGIVGCGTQSPISDANASASSSESSADAASWCASAAAKYPKQFEGMSLKYSVTSTLAAVHAWRAEQGRAGGFQEQIETRFPALASLAPSDPLGVCLFVHAHRPIPQPSGANITADGTRRFVTPDGTWVEDAIGPQAVLLQEMEQIYQCSACAPRSRHPVAEPHVHTERW